jgi:hypothetical protein
MNIMALFHVIEVEEAHKVYTKKIIISYWLSGISWCCVAAAIFQ